MTATFTPPPKAPAGRPEVSYQMIDRSQYQLIPILEIDPGALDNSAERRVLLVDFTTSFGGMGVQPSPDESLADEF
jgi:hypothetical protein